MRVLRLALLLAGMLIAAQPAWPADPRVLTVGVSADVGPLDLARSMRIPPAIILRATNQTLIRRSNHPETRANIYLPQLATRWESNDDQTEWTFHLESGHRFDDGTEVSSAAVAYTFERIFGLGRGTSSSYEFIRAVHTPDRYTVRFELERPHPLLLPLLADAAAGIVNPAVQDRAVDGDFGSQWLSSNTAGSGPYRLVSYQPGSHYILDANPHFKGEIRGFERVVVRVVRDESVRRMQLERGDLDLVMDMSVETVAALERVPGITVHSGPSNAFLLLGLNTERGVMTDRRLREAVSMVVDYEAIVEGIFLHRAEVFRGPLPPGQLGSAPELYPVHHDPARARALVREAGIRPGQRLRMLYTAADPNFEPLALVLQAGMQSIGLNVRLQQLNLAALIDTLGRGTYDAVLTGWVGESNDPAILINYWLDSDRTGSPGNFARYAHPRVDELLRMSVHETDVEKRARMIREIISIANADWPYIYLVQRHQWVAVRDDIQGLSFNPNNAHDHRFERLSRAPR